MNELLTTLLTRGLWSLPYLCIWAVGFGICINFRNSHKIAANLAMTAFLIFFVNAILSFLIQTWLMAQREETSLVSINTGFVIAGAINTLLSVTAWILLLIALYQLLESMSRTQQK